MSFKRERAREESADAAYGLISEVTQCLFYHTLCSKLLGLATLKKRRIKLHFLMGGVSNSLWRGFKKLHRWNLFPDDAGADPWTRL